MNSECNLQQQICYKQSSLPLLLKPAAAETVMTDMDHFPYTRFYRGKAFSKVPWIMERRAGWYPRKAIMVKEHVSPPYELCWQNACHNVLPCKGTNDLSSLYK